MLMPTLPVSIENALRLFGQLRVKLAQMLKTRLYLILTIIAIVTYGIIFSYFTVLKNDVFQSTAWDLGIFNQAFYTTLSRGKLFYYTAELFLNPTGSYFAVHFSPILFLLLPAYAVSQTPSTLLIIQSCILALGALPLYLLAKELLRSDRAGFLLAIVYLLYPAVQAANWFDFHPSAFLPFLFFFLCYFMIKQQWKLYFPCLLLTLMVEEDVVFVVAVTAIYYFLNAGNVKSFLKSIKSTGMDQHLASVITLLICTIYFPISIYAKNSYPINSAYASLYGAIGNFSVLGVKGNPLLFPAYVVLNPQRGLNALTYDYPLKLWYLILLFGAVLFIPFRNKLTIGTLALLSIFLFSNYPAYYMIGSQYALYVLPLIFIATIYGLRNLQPRAALSILEIALIVTLLFAVSVSPLSPIANTFIRQGLVWYGVTSSNLTMGENEKSLNELINLIPNNASVLTQNSVFPHVSNRINAYVLPFADLENSTNYVNFLLNSSEYVLLDLSMQDPMTNLVLNEITNTSSYGVYALGVDSVLFKYDYQGEPISDYYMKNSVLSAYKDLNVAPFAQIVNDPSTTNEVVECPEGSTGYFVSGPHVRLLPGSYNVTFTVKVGGNYDGYIGKCDISDSYGSSILSKRDILGLDFQPNNWTNVTLTFTSTKLMTSTEFRAFSYGTADMYIDKVIIERTSNAKSDFGLRTLDPSDLSLLSGYVNQEGFLVFPQNTTSGTFWYGPYMSIPAGQYRATFVLKISPPSQTPEEHIITLNISANSGQSIIAEYDVNASDFLNGYKNSDWHSFAIQFVAGDNLRNVEFRGLLPSSNFTIYLAYVLVERIN